MTDNQILSVISQDKRLRRAFHKLDKSKRREVLARTNGSGDETILMREIRNIRKEKNSEQ